MNTYVFNSNADGFIDTDDLDIDLLDFLNKRGRIFSSTPLSNITFKRSDLRKFNDLLANDILKHEFNQSIKYSASFSMVNTSTNRAFLKIVVEKCQNNRALGVVYEGLFFTWKLNDSNELNDVNLPFLYCVGNLKFLEFKWLLVLALEHIAHTPTDIHLVFEIPRIESKFSFLVKFNVLKDIWKSARTKTRNVDKIEFEDVALLHASIEEHVINTFGIDLSHFHLKMVSVPGYITLDVSGKVQILKNELFNFFYRVMNDAMSLR